ncbi:hypothetical protein WJX81_002645 [Elliptochloris bilobata]|uniref:Uncharacterized protein n=1 Tax=Elliptochloris bilobata TaxID=381761 RepID=A0AAW1SJU7_9CHLO
MPSQTGKTFLVTVLASVAPRSWQRKADMSEEKGENALENIRAETNATPGDLELMMLDLANFESIENFAKAFKEKHKKLDVLVNNAGVFLPPHEKTPDGLEITMHTNHYGPFLLTHLLLDPLKAAAPSRIVWVASEAEQFGLIDWDDLRGEKDDKSDINMYGRTKVFNLMTSLELNRRLAGSGVVCLACHPGIASTDLYNKMDTSSKLTAKAMAGVNTLVGQSEERGALSLAFCATVPELQEHGGTFYGPNQINLWNTAERKPVNPLAKNANDCARLYNETRRILEECIGHPVPIAA